AQQLVMAPKLLQARELDVRMGEKAGPIRMADEALTGLKQRLALAREEQERDQRQFRQSAGELESVQAELARYPMDGGLVERMAGFEARLEQLQEMRQQSGARVRSVTLLTHRLEEATLALKGCEATWSAVQTRVTVGEAQLSEKRRAWDILLEGREPGAWRGAVTGLQERQTRLDALWRIHQSRQETQTGLAGWLPRREALLRERAELEVRLRSEEQQRLSLEARRGVLEARLSEIHALVSFEQARQRLCDGEACPLCGALEHPFAGGGVPLPDETLEALNRVRQEWQQVQERLQTLGRRRVEIDKDLEQIGSRLESGAESLRALEESGRMECLALSWDAALLDSGEAVRGLVEENRQRLARERERVVSIDALERELGVLRESCDALRQEAQEAERARWSAGQRHGSLVQELERAVGERQELGRREAELVEALDQALREFGMVLADYPDLGGVREALTRRRERRVAGDQRVRELQGVLAKLEWTLNQRAGQMEQGAESLRLQERARQELVDELERLRRDRVLVLGDRHPDREERRLAEAVSEAEQRVNLRVGGLEKARQTLMTLESGAAELARSMGMRAGELDTEEAGFRGELERLGFADEADFRASCLPEGGRKEKRVRERALMDEETELRSLEQEKRALLDKERARRLTDQSSARLEQAHRVLLERQRALQQEMGALRRKREENEAVKQQRSEQLARLELQKRECARWESLHGLIGSEDGKRYREFVQGLTFERVLHQANRQLRKMSDRYGLVQDTDRERPLNIHIIDHYQAGELRSVRNLSGGETFLVSLALALGLSNMASRNIRVDSLFLDEGFGTLDEEALEIALETLAGLRREGKLIGVISHVSALRERIRTRVRVIPRTGGKSVLSGPGCAGGDGKDAIGVN
ncbi:MAG: hypothetical protein HQM00_07135, partial [Magnetococcales bacterium]|nr:hypothetical protein [Magnetococcales bacterium]